MQSQASARKTPVNAMTTPSFRQQPGAPETGRKLAERREAWLERQANPCWKTERRGVEFSALND